MALVDIGGGSTEINLVVRGDVRMSTSVPLGSVRMTEMFCLSDPLLPGHERAMREHLRSSLSQALPAEQLGTWQWVMGSAGTIGALSNFIRKLPSTPRGVQKAVPQRYAFTVRELAKASASLRKMTLARRRKAPGIEERRAEIIVAGTIILEEICAHVQARSVKMMRRGLRDGLMLEEIERLGDAEGLILSGPPVRMSRQRRNMLISRIS